MAKKPIAVETLTHTTAKRRNIPTAEMQSLVAAEDAAPRQVRYPRETPLAQGERRARDPDLDPQLVWRGKDQQDWSDLVVQAPPLYVQEKIHPKAIIADLLRQSRRVRGEAAGEQLSFFDDFSGLPDHEARLEFYAHNQNWSNRFILGDSLHVMASLAEKEGLRGQVQCIYFDPPYGIRFNSNWQVSTRSRDVKDGKIDQISREPEQVKAFRDTWKDGINSYLTYLRDRLTVARDLLHESGSIFVQIGDENVHRVRAVLDEVFGADNLVAQITSTKTGGQTAEYISGIADYVLWYSRNITRLKFRRLYYDKSLGGQGAAKYRSAMRTDGSIRSLGDKLELCSDERAFRKDTLTSQRPPGSFPVRFQGRVITPSRNYWKTHPEGMHRLVSAGRILPEGATGMAYVRFLDDFTGVELTNVWTDIGGIQSRSDPKVYVVQTASKLIERCLLMATDPGDLVLDPTCGSGTTATVAEQWGRRWITIDTSRVALALARARVMGARYPYYLLADSPEGQRKEAEITRTAPREAPTHNDIRQGFVCERVPHITLKSIANNA